MAPSDGGRSTDQGADVGAPDAGPGERSIEQRREDVRQRIAVILVVILGIEVIGAMAAIFLCRGNMPELKDILTLILGPTVALVGSVTGFYFGTHSNGDASDTDPPPAPGRT
ncbi:MAG: hypothetical protein WA459_23435 [Stellaceae bacterium]